MPFHLLPSLFSSFLPCLLPGLLLPRAIRAVLAFVLATSCHLRPRSPNLGSVSHRMSPNSELEAVTHRNIRCCLLPLTVSIGPRRRHLHLHHVMIYPTASSVLLSRHRSPYVAVIVALTQPFPRRWSSSSSPGLRIRPNSFVIVSSP